MRIAKLCPIPMGWAYSGHEALPSSISDPSVHMNPPQRDRC